MLHGTDPAFIPPFPGSVAKFLSKKSPFAQHGTVTGFLALRGGQPVGRIASIVNHSHNAHYGDKVGFFGFFACEDNPATASTLLAASEAHLRALGLTSIRGPYNPSINDDCGLLTSGFDELPSVSMPWNPAYYEALLTHAEFQPVRKLVAFHLPLRVPVEGRIARIAKRVSERGRFRMRDIRMDALEADLKIIHKLYNATLDRNWGFVPISYEDLLAAAGDLRAIAKPDMIMIIEHDGEPCGFGLNLPNFNEILIRTRRFPHWLRLPVIAWLIKTRPITTCRQTILGVLPGFRDRGLSAWLYAESFVRASRHFASSELGWVEENNADIFTASILLGASVSKTFAIYEKPIPA